MNAGRCRLTRRKGRHRFVFHYAPGRESDLLAALVGLAARSESGFDWLDAAAVSLEMGRQRTAGMDSGVRAAMGRRP